MRRREACERALTFRFPFPSFLDGAANRLGHRSPTRVETGGGGGSTSIRNLSTKVDFTDSANSRLLVAGGGGGSVWGAKVGGPGRGENCCMPGTVTGTSSIDTPAGAGTPTAGGVAGTLLRWTTTDITTSACSSPSLSCDHSNNSFPFVRSTAGTLDLGGVAGTTRCGAVSTLEAEEAAGCGAVAEDTSGILQASVKAVSFSSLDQRKRSAC